MGAVWFKACSTHHAKAASTYLVHFHQSAGPRGILAASFCLVADVIQGGVLDS